MSVNAERGHERGYEAYDEDVFRHFLEIERRRAERSGRSLLLLLVDFRSDGESSRIDASVAETLFSALATSVREIDFVGWYRAHRSAGAVLTQGTERPTLDVSRRIGERVGAVLGERLPSHLRAQIEVRVLQLRAMQKNRHA